MKISTSYSVVVSNHLRVTEGVDLKPLLSNTINYMLSHMKTSVAMIIVISDAIIH